MQAVILARRGIDYFVTTVNLRGVRHKIVVENIDANGFLQLLVHHPFTELFCHQFCPVIDRTLVKVVVFPDLHFDVEPATTFIFGLDIKYGDFIRPVIGQVKGIFQLHLHHLILFRNNSVNQRDQ